MARPIESHEEEKSETAIINNNNNFIIKKNSNNNNIPMLFLLGELSGESNHAWLNPKNHTSESKILNIAELEGQTECLASGFGWLLILSRDTSSIFFFNPFTCQRINLPYRKTVISAAAFSASPTSSDCTVFTVKMPSAMYGSVYLDTLLVGQEAWTRHVFGVSKFCGGVQAIHNSRNNCFYCVDPYGRVAVFYAKSGTWNMVPGKGFERACSNIPYLFEFDGEIFAVKKGSKFIENALHRLKIEGGKYAWEKLDLDYLGNDVTLFLGPHGSCALSGLSNITGMENKKLFVGNHNPRSKCLVYQKDIDELKMMMIADARSFPWFYAPIWIRSSEE